MKQYIKPSMQIVNLRAEERIANGSGAVCEMVGSCEINGVIIYSREH